MSILVATGMKWLFSKSAIIHRQRFHQQIETITLVREEFVWKVRTHEKQR